MRGFLRYLDRRLLAAIVVVLVAVVALRVVWLGSYDDSLAAARAEKVEKEQDLAELQSRIVEIKSNGVQGGTELLNRVARLEALVLPSTDVLSVSANFIAVAERNGVALESFVRVDGGEGAREETAARIMRGTRFSFEVRGDFESVNRFLESVVSSDRFVATVDSFTIAPMSQEGDLFGREVKVSGEFLLWSLVEKALTNPVVAATPIGAGSGQGGSGGVPTTLPGTTTTLPGTPTTLPGTPTTVVTVPPTTVVTVPPADLDPRFDSCNAAINAGFGPYVDGDDPEYDFYADEDDDGDGVVCDGA